MLFLKEILIYLQKLEK